ncbi:DUF177 domain-containing protein [Paracoccus suum]|uniref:DUF177 domain-containing protein n=1 Tax=Paracoccus suum TaxID=2259340 RepID=A0A344PKV2_9RHOB|nr:DUF177 domain-containing protein [Paracoccus suum]AXC50007.1 DUF177 domain-containing protein [Paracoccus suum]
MSQSPAASARLNVARLNRRATLAVDYAPDAEARAVIAGELGLLSLPALRLEGKLMPDGDGWRLEGRMTADVVQPCVVSLAPVPAHLDEEVTRVWSPHVRQPEAGGETEMTSDEIEALGQWIDLGEVATESLSLALPLYPRAPGAGLEQPEAEAEAPRRPFANLDKLLKSKD